MFAEGRASVLVSPEKVESALLRPGAEAFGEEFYPTAAEKAAVLLQGVVVAHAFADGNKRLGLGLMLSFLALNGLPIEADEDALYDFIIGVTTGALRDVPEMAETVRNLFRIPG